MDRRGKLWGILWVSPSNEATASIYDLAMTLGSLSRPVTRLAIVVLVLASGAISLAAQGRVEIGLHRLERGVAEYSIDGLGGLILGLLLGEDTVYIACTNRIVIAGGVSSLRIGGAAMLAIPGTPHYRSLQQMFVLHFTEIILMPKQRMPRLMNGYELVDSKTLIPPHAATQPPESVSPERLIAHRHLFSLHH